MLVLSNNLRPILLKLFSSVQRSLLYERKWRRILIADSMLLPELHIGLMSIANYV